MDVGKFLSGNLRYVGRVSFNSSLLIGLISYAINEKHNFKSLMKTTGFLMLFSMTTGFIILFYKEKDEDIN